MSDFLIEEREHLQAEIRDLKRIILRLRYRLRHEDLTDDEREALKIKAADVTDDIEILKLDIGDLDRQIREGERMPPPPLPLEDPLPDTPIPSGAIAIAIGIIVILFLAFS